MKKKIFCLMAMVAVLSSCNYTISMVHTEGTATDVIDNDQKSDADVSPNLTIPASVI